MEYFRKYTPGKRNKYSLGYSKATWQKRLMILFQIIRKKAKKITRFNAVRAEAASILSSAKMHTCLETTAVANILNIATCKKN